MTKKNILDGFIKRHPDGFGFFIPDDKKHPDVFIPRHNMKESMTGDRVQVEAIPERGGDRFSGRIVNITERKTKKVVGVYQKLNEARGLIKDEGKSWGQDLFVENGKLLGAKSGELVSAEVLTYPESPEGFTGKITALLGNALDPLTDVKRVVHTLMIPDEFSQETLSEAEEIPEEVSQADIKNRKDLRDKRFITIDGATAKDFDDAILVETTSQGFKLWVAIADVSHYVKPGTAIDRDAYERGTSVYFPNHVIPMLPEALSNGLCSLNPHVPRLSLVAEMDFDFTGQIMGSQFYEACIQSAARVTYGEAQEVIDGVQIEKLSHVSEQILLASDLAKILMAKRFREGSLDLEIPETQIILDGGGNTTDIIKSERLFAHRLIEEMMLAANVAVATFLSGKEIPAIYRIHESPNPQAMEILESYLQTFGSRVQMGSGKLQKKLTRALQEFTGKPQAQILNILTLRSMSQAKYSSQNLGHFGLGFEFYTHFTSPIRRYPDLIVHRLLKNLILGHSEYSLMSEEELTTAGNILSACEQRAAKAERQFQSIKKARFLEKYIGQEFDGIISSVTRFGVFVLLRDYEVDGLVRIEALSKERLEFDEENLCLIGKRSGLRFSIGDSIRIIVENTNAESGQVDFAIARGGPLNERDGAERFERTNRQDNLDRRSGKADRRANRNEQNQMRPHRDSDKNSQSKSRPKRSGDSFQSNKGKKFRKDSKSEKAEPRSFEKTSSPSKPRSTKAEILDKLDRMIAERESSGKVGRHVAQNEDSFEPVERKKTFFDRFRDAESLKKAHPTAGRRRDSDESNQRGSSSKKSGGKKTEKRGRR